MQKEAWWVDFMEFLLNTIGVIFIVIFYILQPVFVFVSAVFNAAYNHFVKFFGFIIFAVLVGWLITWIK